MRSFFAPNLNVTPDAALKNLSPPHLAYLAAWAVVIAVLCRVMSRGSDRAQRRVLKCLVFSIIASEAARVVWGLYFGLFTIQDWLPLHLCSTIVFIGPVMAYTRNEKLRHMLYAFVYGVSMPAAFFALITPDKPVFSAFTFEFFQTMYSHGAIIGIGVFVLTVMGYRPRLKEVPLLLGILLCLLALCFAVNLTINYLDPQPVARQANYMFLTFAPRDTLLEAFEAFAGRYYILPVVGALLLVWILLFVPWEVYRRQVSK